MRILFVYPNFNLPKRINHGVACLSAFLKQYGNEVILLQINSRNDLKKIKKVREIKPDLILFSVSTTQWQISKYLIKEISGFSKARIFVGGVHPTVFPECIDELEEISGICRGEGEYPLLYLIDKLKKNEPLNNLPNFWVKDCQNVIKNDILPLINNLDELPLPDWSIFEKEALLEYPSFSFSRGCPFACGYCINSALRMIYKDKGNYVRAKSVNRAIEEIKDKVEKYRLKIINFDDDVFLKNKAWLKEFGDRFKKEVGIVFNCNARPENIDDETCEILKRSGAQFIGVGIESGDEEIRKEMLGRYLSDVQIVNSFKMIRKHGLKSYAFNMIGIPGENASKFKKTIMINKKIAPDDLQISIFYPFPGTPLGDLCKNNGFIKYKSGYSYFDQSTLKLKEFPRGQIHKYFDRFEYLVYKDSDIQKAFKFRLSKAIRRHKVLNLISAPLIGIFKNLHSRS